jgi:hypothetical protein
MNGGDTVTIMEADVLRIIRALRRADVALRGEFDGHEVVVHDPEELEDLLEQIEDCDHLLCDRIKERGHTPPT